MARRTKEEAQATRARLLDCAETLFQAQGVSRTSLHDIAQAARYARRIVVLQNGTIAADGTPEQAITPETLGRVYGVEARVERCSHWLLQIMVDRPLEG